MSKLKENIDRILGSSLRCLLPSYWWKRIFGLLVDEIDDVRSTANSKANKSDVTSLSNSVDALSDKVVTVDSSLSTTSTNPVQNKVVTNELNAIYPVFRIRNTKDSGFAAYFAAANRVFQNTDKTNKFPIAIVGKDSGDAICDTLVTTPNANELGLEFNVRNKRYRWVFNAQYGSPDIGAFIREEEVSSESSSGLPIYVAGGSASLTAEQMASNKNTWAKRDTEILYAEVILGIPDGQTLSFKYPISQRYGDTFYMTDWDNGNPNSLLKLTINSDGSVTYNEQIDFATRKAVWIPAQGYASNTISKNIGISFNLDDIPIINEYYGNSWSPTSIVPIYARGTTIRFIREDELIQFKWESATGAYELTSLGRITSDTELSDTSTNPVQNKVVTDAIRELHDALIENEEILAGALTDHETKIKESEKRIGDCITRNEHNLQTVKTTEEIEYNEKVVAYAMVEVKTIIEDLQKRIYQLENRL